MEQRQNQEQNLEQDRGPGARKDSAERRLDANADLQDQAERSRRPNERNAFNEDEEPIPPADPRSGP